MIRAESNGKMSTYLIDQKGKDRKSKGGGKERIFTHKRKKKKEKKSNKKKLMAVCILACVYIELVVTPAAKCRDWHDLHTTSTPQRSGTDNLPV